MSIEQLLQRRAFPVHPHCSCTANCKLRRLRANRAATVSPEAMARAILFYVHDN